MTDQTLSQRVKAQTWDLHEKAEHDTLPQHMVAGTMPQSVYVDMLGQQFLAQSELDAQILASRDACPALMALVDDIQFQGQYLAQDLSHFGIDTSELVAKPGAKALIERAKTAAVEDPLLLLGLHYVREGANNGNRFVAMKLRKSWGIDHTQTDGFRYLDPYGAEQRPRWEAFKTTLDAQPLSEAQGDVVISAAREMFELIMAMHTDHAADLPQLSSQAGAKGHA